MWASRRLLPRAGWLPAAFPAVYATAADGQNGFLTVGLLMGGFALCRRRPFAAGLVLGSLIIKPQLALMLPVAFVASRNWRVIAGASISATIALVGGALLFGFSATQAWLDQAPLIVMVIRNGLVSWSMLSSVYDAARGWGVSPEAAMAIHAVSAVGAAIVVWRTWSSKEADEQLKIAVLCAASALASPYLFFYDGVILIPAFLILATRVQRPILLLALWSLPLLQIGLIAFGISTINLNAGLAIALTAMLFAHWTATAGARETPGSSPILRVEQPSHVTLS
jgi:hypothetical protein